MRIGRISTALAGLSLAAAVGLATDAGAVPFEAVAIGQSHAGLPPGNTNGQTLSGASPVTANAATTTATFNQATASTTSGPASVSGDGWARAGTASSAYSRNNAFLRLENLVVTKLPGFEALPNSLGLTARTQLDYDLTITGRGDEDLQVRLGTGSGNLVLNQGYSASTTRDLILSTIVSATVGTPFDIILNVNAEGNARSNSTGTVLQRTFTASLFVDEVFLLPTGYTISGDIVQDNHLVVPEPAAGLLLAFGVGLLSCKPIRRRAKASAQTGMPPA
jgi:hypothetical protein